MTCYDACHQESTGTVYMVLGTSGHVQLCASKCSHTRTNALQNTQGNILLTTGSKARADDWQMDVSRL